MHDKVKVFISSVLGADVLADGFLDKEDVSAETLVQRAEDKLKGLITPSIENAAKAKFEAEFNAKLEAAKTEVKANSFNSLVDELKTAFPNISKTEVKEIKDLVKAIGKTENDSDRAKLIAELQLAKDSLETENAKYKAEFIPKSELETFKAELGKDQYVKNYYNDLGKVLRDGIPVSQVMKEIKEAVSKVKTSFDAADGKWYILGENNERLIATGKGRFQELSDVINVAIEGTKWAFQDKPVEKKMEVGKEGKEGEKKMSKEEAMSFVMGQAKKSSN
jgi:hypothetical protein